MSTPKTVRFFKLYTRIVAVFWLLIFLFGACSNHQESFVDATSAQNIVNQDTLLNSERIQQKFGSYGIDVLYSDSTTRITNLYSVDADQKIMRTFALVMYPSVVDSALMNEHMKIQNGGSIGQIFKERGWTIVKRTMYMGNLTSSNLYDTVFKMMGDIKPSDLAIYLYSFDVERDGKYYVYARIAEVYHPDYLTAEDLSRIYTAKADTTETGEDLALLLNLVKQYLTLDVLKENK